MKKIFDNVKQKLYISPFFLIAGISFTAAIIFCFYPHNIFQKQPLKTKKLTQTVPAKNSAAKQTPAPTDTLYNIQEFSSAPTANPTPQSTQPPVVQNQTQPTTIPTTVNMQIAEPDGTTTFSLPVVGNVCDELTEAKNEGKIRSVTFNSNYMSSMHSLYITEINGYQNNWTFTINGAAPQGCSLVAPKSGDTIVWKFG